MKYSSKHNQERSAILKYGYNEIAKKYVFALVFSIIGLAAISVFCSNVFAQSPYESGFNHGCDDAKISDYDERYINQPGKGSDYHTSEFMTGYYYGFNSCGDHNDDDSNRNTYFDRFPKAQINDQGEIEIDYDVNTGDRHPEDTFVYHNDDAGGINDLELYRNQMPGPIDDNDDNPIDIHLDFVKCKKDPCVVIDDSITIFLVPSYWSNEEILNGILSNSYSDVYDYKVLRERCDDTKEDCNLKFNIDTYEDGTEIENGNYKLVINPEFDEEELIYINKAEVLTAL